ncbi:ribonuclease, T2 family (plasmid) [Legionella adelaidensis]|uniref:Ribonuclease, T2 family n=2 Tax=Legionella adelaidensis TaxID=45056 RepID=A0A0W0R2H6_9GAMM|nr:ribonuclease, T2 family [Legionella adelaidensis]VEH86004.1 ribonuclease, T2 family [Legionella adelaidensis]
MLKIAIAFFLLPLTALASIPVEGTFEASQFCPAYVSKNKKSNPDNLSAQPNTRYRIIEINRLSPNWVRVEFPAHTPAFRWLKADCGVAQYEIKNNKTCDNTPGAADSQILALNWLPAFCEHYGLEAGKPECLNLSGETFQANNLILHGLWPSQKRCGNEYVYCGGEIKNHYCKYSPLTLTESVAEKLRNVMPGFDSGTCLERHEWSKHGSCQLLPMDEYFTIAIHLTEEVNQTPLAAYLRAHVGETVQKTKLRQMIRQTFGYDTDKKVFLGCTNGMLVDVLIELPPIANQEENLIELVNRSVGTFPPDKCPENIHISDFSHEL